MDFYQTLKGAENLWETEEKGDLLPAFPLSVFPTNPDSSIYSGSALHLTPKTGRTRRWTEPEDSLLTKLAPRYLQNWKQVAKFFPGMPKSAIKRRWENRLDPDIKKTSWTTEEDKVIQELLTSVGRVWKEIAKALPGRPPDMVKNRYYGHIKRLQDIRDRKVREAVVETGLVGACSADWEGLLVQPSKDFLSSQEALQAELSFESEQYRSNSLAFDMTNPLHSP